MKITKWLCASLFVSVLFPLFPLMAEAALSGEQAMSELWDKAWDLKAIASKDLSSRWESLESRSDKVVEVIESNEIDTTLSRFSDSFKYILESGDENAISAILKLEISNELFAVIIDDTAIKFQKAYRDNYGGDDLSHADWNRYRRAVELLLKAAHEKGVKVLPVGVFKRIYPVASPELMKQTVLFDIEQSEVDEAFEEFNDSYLGYLSSDDDKQKAFQKLVALSAGQTPPAKKQIDLTFFRMLSNEKPTKDVVAFFDSVGQTGVDGAGVRLMPYLLKSKKLRDMFAQKQLALNFFVGRENTPFSWVVSNHLDSPDENFVQMLEFVVSHYEVKNDGADKQAVRRLIDSGQEPLSELAAKVPGADTLFAEALGESVSELAQTFDSKVSSKHRKVIKAIISTPYELDYASHMATLAGAGRDELAEIFLDKLSDEQLSEHQQTLFRMIINESTRAKLAGRGFKFTGTFTNAKGKEETVVEKALNSFKSKNTTINLKRLEFVLQHSDLSESQTDLDLLSAAIKDDPSLFRLFARGAFEIATLKQEVSDQFILALKEFRSDDVLKLLGEKSGRKKILAGLEAPQDGFESLICSLVTERKAEDTGAQDKVFKVVIGWVSTQSVSLNFGAITGCTLDSHSALRNMNHSQLGFVLELLFKNNWDVSVPENRALLTKVERRVLDNALQDVIKAHKVEGSHFSLSNLFKFFNALVTQAGGVKVSKASLVVGRLVSDFMFEELNNAELIVPYVDYILPIYPDSLRPDYLQAIYQSGNVEFLAYVLANPEHPALYREHFATIFVDGYKGFDAEVLNEKEAILVQRCIVPEHSANDLVTLTIQHCHSSLVSEMPGDPESCSIVRGDCSPALTASITASVKQILKRKPLSSAAPESNNNQK